MDECLFSGSAAPRSKFRPQWPEWNPIRRPADHPGRERDGSWKCVRCGMINYAQKAYCGCKHPEFMKSASLLPDEMIDRMAEYDRAQQGLL